MQTGATPDLWSLTSAQPSRPLGPWWSAPVLTLYHPFKASCLPPASPIIDRENKGFQTITPQTSLYSFSLLITDLTLPISNTLFALHRPPSPCENSFLSCCDTPHPLPNLLLLSDHPFPVSFTYFSSAHSLCLVPRAPSMTSFGLALLLLPNFSHLSSWLPGPITLISVAPCPSLS